MKKELSKQILLSEDSQNPSEETAMSAEDLFHSFGFLGFSEEDVVIKLSDGRQLSVLVTFDEWKELFSSSPLSDYYGEEGEEDDLFPPASRELFWKTELFRKRGKLPQDYFYYLVVAEIDDNDGEDEEKPGLILAEVYCDDETISFLDKLSERHREQRGEECDFIYKPIPDDIKQALRELVDKEMFVALESES